jgi:hypothetical protein
VPKDDSQLDTIPELKQGTYSDGRPLDDVHYLECKIVLKPDRFTSLKSFIDFGKLVNQVAKESGVELFSDRPAEPQPQIKEVVFLDTADFRLYNNAFILRRRVTYQSGFPVGDPEIVLKFRHPDLQKAAELDVRPSFPCVFQVKFKVEALPLRDKVGGMRLLFSHNVEFGMSQAPQVDRGALGTLVRVLPCLAPLKKSDTETVDLVNQTIIEEVLVELGNLDFGKGVGANANVALWRGRGDHKPIVGEFSFQTKFDRKDELHTKALHRCEQFFCSLQNIASDWVALGTTKTGAVYRLGGKPTQSHE